MKHLAVVIAYVSRKLYYVLTMTRSNGISPMIRTSEAVDYAADRTTSHGKLDFQFNKSRTSKEVFCAIADDCQPIRLSHAYESDVGLN